MKLSSRIYLLYLFSIYFYGSQSFEDFRNLCWRTKPIAVGAVIKVGKNHLRENISSSTLTDVFG